MSLPRMRTAPQAIEELKKLDPDTSFTLRALRRMINNGEIPVINVESKRLINFDLLLEKLSCYNISVPMEQLSNGKIHKVY